MQLTCFYNIGSTQSLALEQVVEAFISKIVAKQASHIGINVFIYWIRDNIGSKL